MSEANTDLATESRFLTAEELKRKVKVVSQQARVITQQHLSFSGRSLRPEELATLFNAHPEHNLLWYSDIMIDMHSCRLAIDRFEHWTKRAVAIAETPDEFGLANALRMMGHAIGTWHH